MMTPVEPNLAAEARHAVRTLAHIVSRGHQFSKEDGRLLHGVVAALGSPAEAATHQPGDSTAVTTSNPCSPELDCTVDLDGLHGTVVFSDVFEGIGEFAHGGFIAVAMERALGTAALFHATARSASMTVDYRSPAPIGRILDIRARVDRIEGRKHWVSGSISHGDCTLAEGHGLWVALRTD